MRTLIAYLPVIACVALMALICIPMMRNMHKGHGETDDPDTQREIAELREEIALLKAERALEDKTETVDG
ncbi:MAG: hypothetical protein M3277_12645 [Actinomycetota bacterium]|nr:hypothetical protein [Actinomycetota bacterium]